MDKARTVKRFSLKKHLLKAVDNLYLSTSNSLEDYVEILRACIYFEGIEEARRIYSHLTYLGNDNQISICNKIINIFIKSGSMIDAKNVFLRLTNPDIISWSSIIKGYAIHGCGFDAFKTYEQMKRAGLSPNKVTFLCILHAADSALGMAPGCMVYSEIVEIAMDADLIIGTVLVSMFSKFGRIEDACSVFESMENRDVVSCTAMINLFTQHGLGREALQLFEQMLCEGIMPNEFTSTSILGACASLVDCMQGVKVHILVLRGCVVKVSKVVGAALVHMYAKCGNIQMAHTVFATLGERDVTAWTALITGYARNRCFMAALELFRQMQAEVLEADVVVGNALIDLFIKCNNLIDAKRVFDNMVTKDIITWSTLISGYAQHEANYDAIEIFLQMLREKNLPDEYSMSSVLLTCANLNALLEGMEAHASIVEFGLDSDVVVQNAVLNMYAKCGGMADAKVIFGQLPYPDVEAWNTMILGYGHLTCGQAAHDLFQRFLKTALEPDEYTLTGVLNAYASSNMLSEGKELHMHIIRTGFERNNVVANALTDMYAACGSLKEALAVFSTSNNRELIAWSSVIGGCAQHGYGIESLHLYQQMQQEGIEPDELSLSSVLAGCSYAGLVEEGCFFFIMMSNVHLTMVTWRHYVIVVDLLGRSGHLYKALEFLYRMAVKPHYTMWVSLLAACRSHDLIELADLAAHHAFDFGSQSSSAYILLANTYVNTDRPSGTGNNDFYGVIEEPLL